MTRTFARSSLRDNSSLLFNGIILYFMDTWRKPVDYIRVESVKSSVLAATS